MKKELIFALAIIVLLVPYISADEDNSTDTNSTDDNSTGDSNTDFFNVTKTNKTAEQASYNLDFNIDKSRVQLGDTILITGNIYKNGNPMDDQINLIFYFISGNSQNEIYLSSFDGTYSLSPKLRDVPSGNYRVDVDLVDLKGGLLERYEDLGVISIDSKLVADITVDENQLNPGDSLQLLGTVTRNLDGEIVPKGTATILLDGIQYTSEISNGNLDFTLPLNEEVTSGNRDLLVRVEDGYGNVGGKALKLNVIAQQKYLEIILSQKTFSPEEEVVINGKIFDQANQEMVGTLTATLFDPNDKKILSEQFETGNSVSYTLEESALPGEWKIFLESSKLEAEEIINVPIVQSLDISLEGQKIMVRNSGNVNYEDPLIIEAITVENEEEQIENIELRTGLVPGEIMEVYLEKYLDDKEYSLLIENTEQTFDIGINDQRSVVTKTGDYFKSLTGQAVRIPGSKNSNGPTYFFGIIILLLVLMTGYMYSRRKVKRRKTSNYVPDKEGKKHTKLFKKNKEKENIEDFKSRILKDIQESQIKQEKEEKNNVNVQPFVPFGNKEKNDQTPKRFNFDRPLKKDE